MTISNQKNSGVLGVLLAGGDSSRFGVENKLFVEIEGRAIIEITTQNLIDSEVESVKIVTGYQAERVEEDLLSDSGNQATSIIADLSLQNEVKRAADEFLSLNKPLHILLNNAGIMNRERKETADGFEEVFSVNHLAYFSLTLMLLDKMKSTGGGRVVNVASMAYRFVNEMNFEDLHSKENYKG